MNPEQYIKQQRFEECKLLYTAFNKKDKTFDIQVFIFSVVTLILVSFAIHTSLSYDIATWFYTPFALATACCTASVWLLLNTYQIASKMLSQQMEEVYMPTTEGWQKAEVNQKEIRCLIKYSIRMLITGFTIAVVTIFMILFTL